VRTAQLLLITALVFGLGVARSAEPMQIADAADWTKIGGTDQFALLVNPPSIEHGMPGKAWLLYDFFDSTKNAYGHFTFRSFKALEYFHCSDHTSAIKSAVFYNAPMGEGEVVKSITHLDREMRFSPLVPGSADAEVGNLVCGAPADPKG
jgi:hypothetical protein